MYIIYSGKGKKLGEVTDTGDIETSNQKLKSIYETILNFGVFLYSVKKQGKKVEVIRTSVIKTDGEKFLIALVNHLEYLGFILKREEVVTNV